MKNRLYVLGFAALLLTGTWGMAHAQSPSADPAAAPSALAVTPIAAPSCQASIPGLDLTPNPSLKGVTCGSCSHEPCRGLAPNAHCYYLAGGVYHLAKCVINGWCSEESKSYCDCTNNPPV